MQNLHKVASPRYLTDDELWAIRNQEALLAVQYIDKREAGSIPLDFRSELSNLLKILHETYKINKTEGKSPYFIKILKTNDIPIIIPSDQILRLWDRLD